MYPELPRLFQESGVPSTLGSARVSTTENTQYSRLPRVRAIENTQYSRVTRVSTASNNQYSRV